MKRGDLITVALQGDLGKPRPALLIQADVFAETSSVSILPITSDMTDAPLLRISLTPSETNGLRKPSQVMVDKPMTVKREKIDNTVGRLEAPEMLQIDRALALFLGIAS